VKINEITESIIGAAIEVHRAIGPGLLESAYTQCLCYELTLRKLPFNLELPLPIVYKGLKLDCGYRLDLVVANAVVVEVKAVESLIPVHTAQLLTYLRFSVPGKPVSSSTSTFHCCETASYGVFFNSTKNSPQKISSSAFLCASASPR
jgi:GxxExxY protein